MLEMRWYNNGALRQLQYRQLQNTTIYAGMPTEADKARSANYQWSAWSPVPEFFEPPVAPIDSELVTTLRAETDYPMMECKKALVMCNGDFELAKEYLRTGRVNMTQLVQRIR